MPKHGTICIEGDWGWKGTSVKPVMELIKASCKWPYTLRSADIVNKFWSVLETWADRMTEEFPVVYMAFHGAPGVIEVGRSEIELDEIAEHLDGRAVNTVFHFASCSTVYVDRRHLDRFLEKSGAVAIAGYKDDVDWLQAAAFDALLLDTILHHEISARGLRQIDVEMKQLGGGLCRELDFRFECLPYS